MEEHSTESDTTKNNNEGEDEGNHTEEVAGRNSWGNPQSALEPSAIALLSTGIPAACGKYGDADDKNMLGDEKYGLTCSWYIG
jgi:hypothetical protein